MSAHLSVLYISHASLSWAFNALSVCSSVYALYRYATMGINKYMRASVFKL